MIHFTVFPSEKFNCVQISILCNLIVEEISLKGP
ncbi:unnamed protein product [Larinioides sclopetarius]|uniref:Uncharacterized protein n=1 Tax=Larinioides sclopetarius TaxID=280406 RepID=A0AAV2A8S0_9ARAC